VKNKLILHNKWFWLVSITGIIFDQLTKYLIVENFARIGDSFPLIKGVFHLTYVVNTGAAFSFFSGGVNWLRWLSLFVSLGLILLAWFYRKMPFWEQLGYGFILAGAFGNGIDRFLFDHVVDFLDFRLIRFPIFNLADVCINVGIIFLLYATWKTAP